MRNREHMSGDQRCAGSAINVRRQFRHYLLEVEWQAESVGYRHLCGLRDVRDAAEYRM
jgi:hypothetical protein